MYGDTRTRGCDWLSRTGRRMEARTLLTVGFLSLAFTLFSTFLTFGYEFELRPRHSACFYGQQQICPDDLEGPG